jgi:hypothetical protein
MMYVHYRAFVTMWREPDNLLHVLLTFMYPLEVITSFWYPNIIYLCVLFEHIIFLFVLQRSRSQTFHGTPILWTTENRVRSNYCRGIIFCMIVNHCEKVLLNSFLSFKSQGLQLKVFASLLGCYLKSYAWSNLYYMLCQASTNITPNIR